MGLQKRSSSFNQTAELAESEGTFCALWEKPGSNPGPWAPERSARPTALLAPVHGSALLNLRCEFGAHQWRGGGVGDGVAACCAAGSSVRYLVSTARKPDARCMTVWAGSMAGDCPLTGFIDMHFVCRIAVRARGYSASGLKGSTISPSPSDLSGWIQAECPS